MLTARCLSDAGAHVLLLERGYLGREASWAAGGILSPLYPWRYPAPVNRMAAASQRVYVRLANNLKDETGIDPEWIQSGMLVLDAQEQESMQRWSTDFGMPLEQLDWNALHHCEPALASSFNGGFWLPTISQIRSPQLGKALRASLDARGIEYREHTEVLSLDVKDGAVTSVKTIQGVIYAGRVLIASGAWSARLVPPQYMPIEVEPVRGQMILIKAPPRLLRRIILYDGDYLIPRRDGHILAGSTLEDAGFDKATTAQARTQLRTKAVEWVPALSDYPILHHWSGLRPGSPAGIPYIGEHPGIRGLFFNTGHFRCGVALAPASAQLAADLVLGRTPTLPPEPYALTPSARLDRAMLTL
jgi:glycine oxidase